MTIKLIGKTLDAIGVRGERVYYQGADRDCLTFLFDAAQKTLDEVDKEFTAEACESITIVEDPRPEEGQEQGKEYIHKGYVLRKGLEKAEEDGQQKIFVRMAQRTQMEQEVAELSKQVNETMLAMCELYESGLEE